VCLLCVWHAIVGAFWVESDAIIYDRALLIAFSIAFLLIHVFFLLWYLNASRHVINLKNNEISFLKQIKDEKLVEMSLVNTTKV